jgi:osmotically-inducible protein OsmY
MPATIVRVENLMRVLLILGSLAASAAAFAQPADFETLDRNGDGHVSRVEAIAAPEIAKRFGQFDANKDRLLSKEEYQAALADNERRAQRDAALTARVKAALSAERSIPTSGIAVDAYEGEVQLSGFVPAPDLASRAGRLTAAVSGVRMVHNNLAVRPQR